MFLKAFQKHPQAGGHGMNKRFHHIFFRPLLGDLTRTEHCLRPRPCAASTGGAAFGVGGVLLMRAATAKRNQLGDLNDPLAGGSFRGNKNMVKS